MPSVCPSLLPRLHCACRLNQAQDLSVQKPAGTVSKGINMEVMYA